jgi:hypothetical protein
MHNDVCICRTQRRFHAPHTNGGCIWDECCTRTRVSHMRAYSMILLYRYVIQPFYVVIMCCLKVHCLPPTSTCRNVVVIASDGNTISTTTAPLMMESNSSHANNDNVTSEAINEASITEQTALS